MIQKFALFLFLLLLPVASVAAQEETQKNPVDIYFFWAIGCPHCEDEKPFLEELKEDLDYVTVHDFEVTKNRDNAKLLQKASEELSADASGVPLTVVGDKYFVGWQNKMTTGLGIVQQVKNVRENDVENVVGNMIDGKKEEEKKTNENLKESGDIDLPLFGTISPKNYSLPVLTFFIAAVDGFNPCAMWVLVFLITLLFGLKDRKRMWILGGTFIVTSAFVYFIFMVGWLKIFTFISFVEWIRWIIGAVAIVFGVRSVREYYTNPAGTCKVTTGNKQQKVFEKLKAVIQQKSFLLSLGGIIVLAFVVNLVELVCSAGLPAVFIQLLTLSDLSASQYYGYILFYVIIFMLDDMIVFGIAMTTLKLTGLSGKYTRMAQLVGGVVMFILGILLILKPEWLMFG